MPFQLDGDFWMDIAYLVTGYIIVSNLLWRGYYRYLKWKWGQDEWNVTWESPFTRLRKFISRRKKRNEEID